MTTITKEQIEILKRGIALSAVNISAHDANAARLVIHDLLNQPEPEPVVWQMKAIFSSNKWVDITKAQCEAVEKTDAYTREPRAVHTRILYTHPPAPNQAQWQPIDTAPATPAAILLLTTSRTMKIETGHWARDMVYSSKADGDDCFYTHWMPLPTPPIDEAKDKP